MATMQPRIFVSHSSKDHDFCLRLVDDLQAVLGDENAVWYDARGGLHGGDTWWRKIMQELKARTVFIVVLSPDSVISPWVNSEIDLAWRQKHSPSGKLIFPLLYRHCEIRDDLDILQIISFLPPKPYEVALEELLLALGLALKKARNQLDTDVTPQKTKEQWIDEGISLDGLKRYEEAITAFDQAIRLDPNNARAYSNKGISPNGLKRYEEAIAAFDQASRIGKDKKTQR